MGIGSISDNIWIGLSAVFAILIVVALVLLRSYTGGKSEVTIADAAIALVPIIFVLFATGKIDKLGIGPSGITVESAIVNAADADVLDQVEVLDQVAETDEVLAVAKGGLDSIPKFLRQGVQALTFRVGGNYVDEIIESYFRQLTQSPRFQYFIVLEPSKDRFFGIMDARQLLALIDQKVLKWSDLEKLIKDKPLELSELDGFIRLDSAVQETVTKREALMRLEETGLEWLPVVNEKNQFVGVINRSKVTASLILDITNTLSKR